MAKDIKLYINNINAGTFYYCNYAIDTKDHTNTLIIRHDDRLVYCISYTLEAGIVENEKNIIITINN